MNIVIDTNIFIAVLLKDSAVRYILLDSIDSDDAPFFATSLAFDCCPIWSDDKKLKNQDKILFYNTKEIIAQI